ncbi:methyltransferase domain-containing protein [Chamaesiphon sp. OTE_75_metabat_556]|uniref:class I SAM-dependent methyltransferase n=1 Tax=Chamaesiphon sp. OTE_75_metabat_556 TaxID=2964692 RepID=UPI00286A2E53|nr:methyltransferase domain-containing protein [Chamaesiphon sp. OTE_75_metabat_556]
MKNTAKKIIRQIVPAPVLDKLIAKIYNNTPAVGCVNFGGLRRLNPISREFGYDRGLPIDRYYIENFLDSQSLDVHGRVLEIGDATYTRRFGGDRVTKSDVLHVIEGNPAATIVGDLTNSDLIPSASFDCLILTQTLQLIYNLQDAVTTIDRILKPGGVALITVPGISQIAIDEWKDYWCWSFTEISARRLFTEIFPADNVTIEYYGNILTTTAFLQGLATQELTTAELDDRDPCYQMLITIRVVKP